MARWHVWGDFVHTLPPRISGAKLEQREDSAARKTADAAGFDFDQRMRNGFEPWAATFLCDDEDGVEFAFASYPIVRGWKRL